MFSALNISRELQARVRDSFSPETAFGLVHCSSLNNSINADYDHWLFHFLMYFKLRLIWNLCVVRRSWASVEGRHSKTWWKTKLKSGVICTVITFQPSVRHLSFLIFSHFFQINNTYKFFDPYLPIHRTTCMAFSARLLGVLISPDLTLKQHISRVCVSCFYQLRQIRSVRRSLDDESTATPVHAFVASRIDYCCSLLFGSVTDKLQRVLNAAARVVTNARKYDRGLHHTMRHHLHWLDMTDRI